LRKIIERCGVRMASWSILILGLSAARIVGSGLHAFNSSLVHTALTTMCRTKPTLIYLRTGNLPAVLLLGHTKIESMVRYLGIKVTTRWHWQSRLKRESDGGPRTIRSRLGRSGRQ